jgi:hypothetical protein
MGNSAGLTLEGNWFEGNFADLAGGGIHVDDGSVALVNANTIVTNTAYSGAGVSVSFAGVDLHEQHCSANIVTSSNPGLSGGLKIGGTAARSSTTRLLTMPKRLALFRMAVIEQYYL